MTTELEHTIFLVDDEPSILKSLQRLLRKEKTSILTASSGIEGLEALVRHKKPVSLIISDQRMPGMTGAEFLEKTKRLFPDAIRFLLTGYSDMDAVIDAVNKGEIHRYFTKPWNDDELVLQVRQAIEQYELKTENKRLLILTKKQNKQLYEFGKLMEQKVKERSEDIIKKNKELLFLNKELELNLFNTVRAFATLTEMYIPLLEGHGKRVSGHSREIAKKFNLPENEITHVEIAAMIHDIGKMGFPKRLWENQDEITWSIEERALYKKHPEEGKNVVAFIDRLDEVGRLIRHHHEQFDGRGYPDGLAGNAIPLGARIIAVTDSYDKIIHLKPHTEQFVEKYQREKSIPQDALPQTELIQGAAIYHLTKGAGVNYDPKVVKVFLEVLKEEGIKSAANRELTLNELKEGMVLGRALYTTRGKFLLPYQTVLTDAIIKRLKIFLDAGEIQDGIAISQK